MARSQTLETTFAFFSLAWSLTSIAVSFPYAIAVDLAILLVLLLGMDVVDRGFRINSPFSRFCVPFLSCIGAFYMTKFVDSIISLGFLPFASLEFWLSFVSLFAVVIISLLGGLISFESVLKSDFSKRKGPFFRYLRKIEKNFYGGKRFNVTKRQALDEMSKIFLGLTLFFSFIVFLLVKFSFSIAIISTVWIIHDLYLFRTGKTRRTFVQVLSRDVSIFFLIPFYYAAKNLKAAIIVGYLWLSFLNVSLFALLVDVSSLFAQLAFSPILIYHAYFGIQLMKRVRYSTIEGSNMPSGLIPGLLYGDIAPIIIWQSLLTILFPSSFILSILTGPFAIQANLVFYLPLTIFTVALLLLFLVKPRYGGIREVKWDLFRAAAIGVSGLSFALLTMPYFLGVAFMIITALIVFLPFMRE